METSQEIPKDESRGIKNGLPLRQRESEAQQMSKRETKYKKENLDKNAAARVPEEIANENRNGI